MGIGADEKLQIDILAGQDTLSPALRKLTEMQGRVASQTRASSAAISDMGGAGASAGQSLGRAFSEAVSGARRARGGIHSLQGIVVRFNVAAAVAATRSIDFDRVSEGLQSTLEDGVRTVQSYRTEFVNLVGDLEDSERALVRVAQTGRFLGGVLSAASHEMTRLLLRTEHGVTEIGIQEQIDLLIRARDRILETGELEVGAGTGFDMTALLGTGLSESDLDRLLNESLPPDVVNDILRGQAVELQRTLENFRETAADQLRGHDRETDEMIERLFQDLQASQNRLEELRRGEGEEDEETTRRRRGARGESEEERARRALKEKTEGALRAERAAEQERLEMLAEMEAKRRELRANELEEERRLAQERVELAKATAEASRAAEEQRDQAMQGAALSAARNLGSIIDDTAAKAIFDAGIAQAEALVELGRGNIPGFIALQAGAVALFAAAGKAASAQSAIGGGGGGARGRGAAPRPVNRFREERAQRDDQPADAPVTIVIQAPHGNRDEVAAGMVDGLNQLARRNGGRRLHPRLVGAT